jgi:hypothetical protein
MAPAAVGTDKAVTSRAANRLKYWLAGSGFTPSETDV